MTIAQCQKLFLIAVFSHFIIPYLFHKPLKVGHFTCFQVGILTFSCFALFSHLEAVHFCNLYKKTRTAFSLTDEISSNKNLKTVFVFFHFHGGSLTTVMFSEGKFDFWEGALKKRCFFRRLALIFKIYNN